MAGAVSVGMSSVSVGAGRVGEAVGGGMGVRVATGAAVAVGSGVRLGCGRACVDSKVAGAVSVEQATRNMLIKMHTAMNRATFFI
jgi:hypothetical protein